MRIGIKMSVRSLSILAVVASTLPTFAAANDAWNRQFVDTTAGKFSTLLIDNAGNAQVSYVNEESHLLRYAFWDHVLDKWFTMTIDDHSGGFASMALDSKQRAHISYHDYGTGHLRYAHWDGTTWKREAIQLSAHLLEFYTSIALDREDHPTISCYEVADAENGFSLRLRAATWTGQAWEVATIDETKGSGKFNFLMTRPDGHLSIAYANVRDENASLRYAASDGSSWKVTVVEGALRAFYVHNVSGLVDSTGAPHIAYTEISHPTVKYACIRNGQWERETVSTIAQAGYPDRNGIALDEDGTPYISYYDAGRGVLHVGHREADGWKSEVVDDNFAGFTSSLKISHDRIFISYLDMPTGSLKVATRAIVRPKDTNRAITRNGPAH